MTLAVTILKIAPKGLPRMVEAFLVRHLTARFLRKLSGEKGEVIHVELECFGELLDEVRTRRAATVMLDVIQVLRGDRHTVIALDTRRELSLTKPELLSRIKNRATERALGCDVVASECKR